MVEGVRVDSAGGQLNIQDPRPLRAIPLDEAPEQLGGGVYFLRDEDGKIIYVGQTGDYAKRLKTHARDKKKAEVASFSLLPMGDHQRRLAFETAYIALLRPRLNRAIMIRIANGRLSEIRYRRKVRRG